MANMNVPKRIFQSSVIMSLALMLVTFAAIANTTLMAIEKRIYRLK